MISILKNFIYKTPNLIITLSNMFTFMTVQILFFYFVATKLFSNLIQSKAVIIKKYNEFDSNTKEIFQDFKNSPEYEKLKRITKNQEELRTYLNIQLILKKLIPIVMFIFFLILINIIVIRLNNENFVFVDWILLFLVIFAFTTELIYFFFIVQQYYFAGDIELIKRLYDKLVDLYYKNT